MAVERMMQTIIETVRSTEEVERLMTPPGATQNFSIFQYYVY